MMERSKHIWLHIVTGEFVFDTHTHQAIVLAVHMNIKQTLHSFSLVCLFVHSFALFHSPFLSCKIVISIEQYDGNNRQFYVQTQTHTQIYLYVHKTVTSWFCSMIYEARLLPLLLFCIHTKTQWQRKDK